VVLLDTSALVGALAGPRAALPRLEVLLSRGEPLRISALTLYEWRRGARTPGEIARQEALFPDSDAVPFSAADAHVAAGLYRRVTRPRGREMDLVIAACALRLDAGLWTLNRRDFADIPGLRLI
jgi:predicted nucleic acid-binding protein